MKKLFFFASAIFFNMAIYAQQRPISWTIELNPLEEGEAFELVCKATIQDGWYIYSQFLNPDEGPIPTSIMLDENEAIEVIGEPSESGHKKEGHDPIFDMFIVKFSKTVDFVQKIKLTDKSTTISGVIEYMTCDDEQCLPPTEVPFSLTLE